MGNRGLGVVNHAAELGEELAEMMSRSDRRAEEIQVFTPIMAMSGTVQSDTALTCYNERRGTWNAPAPELYRLAWECEDCGHRYYDDLPPIHCPGCQGSHYKSIKLRVQDAEQSDTVVARHVPVCLLDNFGIHRDLIPPEPEPQPLGWIVRG